ncbi:MAG: hypothetical protein ACK5RL_03645 [Acidimicrobiales bacterium]
MRNRSTDTPQDDGSGDGMERHADDPSMAEFVAAARAAVSVSDPVPAEVTELAKLAYAFRDVETIEPVDGGRLVGVRSAGSDTLQAATDGATLIWSETGGTISGVLHAAVRVTLALQTLSSSADVELDDGTGAFEVRAPVGAHRLVVTEPDRTWATIWAD